MTNMQGSATLPELSVKRYVTVVLPTGKISPGAADWLTRLATPEMSEALGSVKKTATLVVPSSTVRVAPPMQMTDGGVVSTKGKRS